MRILFLDQFSSLGGGQQCLRDLIAGLVSRGHTAHAGIPGDGPLIRHLTAAGAVVHSLSLTRYTDGSKSVTDVMSFVRDMPRLALTIRGLIHEHLIDLVYVNGPRLLPAAALATSRLVFHSHSLLVTGYSKRLAGLALRARAARVIASSNFVARPLRPYVAPERLRVIYNGVADCRLPGATTRSTAPTVGIVGRIAPEKGHLDFIEAARCIRESSPGTSFVICGDGQHSGEGFSKQVRLASEGLPVEFVPWQEDVRAVLNRLDVLVVPSRSLDATPRVIPEALSAGVSVAAYRTGGIPEMLGDDLGVLSPAGDPRELARGILQLLNRPDDVRQRNRMAYQQRFTLDRYVREIGTVLDSELARFSNNPRIISPANKAASPASARTTR